MGKTEHRVSVENGKYTFVVPADDYRVSILRYGEPWHGPQAEASNALHQIMMVLDAARVVVDAARKAAESLERLPLAVAQEIAKQDTANGLVGLVRAIDKHDSLVDDREPPSAWCGAEYAERAAAAAQQISESRATYQALRSIDTAETIAALETLWTRLETSNIGDVNRADAYRRYWARRQWLINEG